MEQSETFLAVRGLNMLIIIRVHALLLLTWFAIPVFITMAQACDQARKGCAQHPGGCKATSEPAWADLIQQHRICGTMTS